jgi:hypothetical protein
MRTKTPNPHCAVLLICLLAVALPAIDFRGAQTVTLDGFETRGTGKAQWELYGKTARLHGGLYELDSIRLVVYREDGSRATITSPKCTFDPTKRVAFSDAPIKVVSEGMTLEGVGYDFAIDRKRLRIRSQVKMRAKQLGSELSAEEVFGPLSRKMKPEGDGDTVKRSPNQR